MNKFLCENILKENENNRILRLGMVLSENGGLIYKLIKYFLNYQSFLYQVTETLKLILSK